MARMNHLGGNVLNFHMFKLVLFQLEDVYGTHNVPWKQSTCLQVRKLGAPRTVSWAKFKSVRDAWDQSRSRTGFDEPVHKKLTSAVEEAC